MNNFNEPKEFTLINLVKLVLLNKKFLILTVGIFTLIILAVSFIIPHTYGSTTTLLPPKKDGGSGGLSTFIQNFTGGSLNLGGIGQSDESKVFSDILKSRTVFDYIIDKMELKKKEPFSKMSQEKIQKHLGGSIFVDVNKSGIINVSAVAQTGLMPSAEEGRETAKFSADLANTAVQGLDIVIRNRSMSSAKQSKEYVEREIQNYLVKLDSIETKLEHFQQENKVLAIDEQTQAIVSQAIEVGSQLAKADLEKNLALLQYQPGSPQYLYYQRQHDLLSEQYRKIQQGGLTEDETFSIPLEKVPALIKEYTNLFRERKIIEQVILYLETQRHQEAIQEKRDVPVVEVLDSAYPPDERNSPKRTLMLVLAVALSLIFSMIYIAFKGFTSGSLYVHDSKSIETAD